MIVRNAIKLDYCVREAIASLCAVCDEVVVLDCQSDDGTREMLFDLKGTHLNLGVMDGGQWACADNFERLAILTNKCKSYLSTDWVFNLQADEVIHEDSFPYIRKAIEGGVYDSFMCRRLNFFGDFDHYLGFDIPHTEKPCSDAIFRLAHVKYDAHEDAESLKVDPRTCSSEYVDQIRIFHYGFVRNEAKQIDKILSMQSWFWGPESQPDARAVKAKKECRGFDWREFKSPDLLRRFTGTHPRFATDWIAERRQKEFPVT